MVMESAALDARRRADEGRSGSLVKVTDLKVRRGETLVLDIPGLEISEGEVLAVIGPNGAGKSTLLHTLALLLPASSGEISFGGRSISKGDDLVQFRRRMAVVFQEALLLNCSVRENVAAGLKLRGVPKGKAEERASYWMKRFGVDSLADRPSRQLSGGEAQRVSLARAFALEPELLLLDEPFSALDAPTRAALFEDFERVLRDSGITTVFVTHDRMEAMRLGDRIAVVIGGCIAQVGEPEAVFSTPASQQVAAFVGMENIIPGRVSEQREGLALVSLRSSMTIEVVSDAPAGQRVLACLRPEDVVVAPMPSELPSSSARNKLRARITRITPLGSQSRLSLDCGFPLEALITRRSAEELSLQVGLEVLASFKATAVHLLSR
ncbi:MAG TPA: ABC transporter ATP-binding protein [Chloroflexota bacterium]|nr:ABC transporter ATP-binding protein [Chloroflexota bacterium]